MLRGAMVGLKAAKAKMPAHGDHLSQLGGFGARGHATARGPHVNLNERAQSTSGRLGGGFEQPNAFGGVNADGDFGDPAQRREARQLPRRDDLVTHQNVSDAAPGEDFGFGDLLDALADGAARSATSR